MTRKTFYRKLREVAHQFKWKVRGDGALRAIRGNKDFCPITAVNYIINKKCVDVNSVEDAAYTLNMNHYDCASIVGAADEHEEYIYGNDKFVRRALLRSVNLT